jgi:hypothetical protein
MNFSCCLIVNNLLNIWMKYLFQTNGLHFFTWAQTNKKQPYLICSPTPTPEQLLSETAAPLQICHCLVRSCRPASVYQLVRSVYRSSSTVRACSAFPAQAPLPSVPKAKAHSDNGYPRGPNRIRWQTDGRRPSTGQKKWYTDTYHWFTNTRFRILGFGFEVSI